MDRACSPDMHTPLLPFYEPEIDRGENEEVREEEDVPYVVAGFAVRYRRSF